MYIYINKLSCLNVIKINGKTNRHCIYGNYNITLCKPWSLLMDFMHLYGRKLWHPENRDQLELCRSLCIWTPNLPLSLVQCPAPGCKLEGQVVRDNHCLLLCLNSPSIRNDILRGVAFKKKKKKRAFNINDLVLIVMDILCRDTLPSRA